VQPELDSGREDPGRSPACYSGQSQGEDYDGSWREQRDEGPSTTGPDVWTRFFDLRRCQPGVPGDQAFLLDLAL